MEERATGQLEVDGHLLLLRDAQYAGYLPQAIAHVRRWLGLKEMETWDRPTPPKYPFI